MPSISMYPPWRRSTAAGFARCRQPGALSPQRHTIATERAQISGTLERVGRDWLVVRGAKSTYWVPRETVLAVEFVD